MSQRLLEQIRDAILNGEYDLTRHAIDEMAEDGLGIFDVESAILGGEIKDGDGRPTWAEIHDYRVGGRPENGSRGSESFHRDRHLSHYHRLRGH